MMMMLLLYTVFTPSSIHVAHCSSSGSSGTGVLSGDESGSSNSPPSPPLPPAAALTATLIETVSEGIKTLSRNNLQSQSRTASNEPSINRSLSFSNTATISPLHTATETPPLTLSDNLISKSVFHGTISFPRTITPAPTPSHSLSIGRCPGDVTVLTLVRVRPGWTKGRNTSLPVIYKNRTGIIAEGVVLDSELRDDIVELSFLLVSTTFVRYQLPEDLQDTLGIRAEFVEAPTKDSYGRAIPVHQPAVDAWSKMYSEFQTDFRPAFRNRSLELSLGQVPEYENHHDETIRFDIPNDLLFCRPQTQLHGWLRIQSTWVPPWVESASVALLMSSIFGLLGLFIVGPTHMLEAQSLVLFGRMSCLFAGPTRIQYAKYFLGPLLWAWEGGRSSSTTSKPSDDSISAQIARDPYGYSEQPWAVALAGDSWQTGGVNTNTLKSNGIPLLEDNYREMEAILYTNFLLFSGIALIHGVALYVMLGMRRVEFDKGMKAKQVKRKQKGNREDTQGESTGNKKENAEQDIPSSQTDNESPKSRVEREESKVDDDIGEVETWDERHEGEARGAVSYPRLTLLCACFLCPGTLLASLILMTASDATATQRVLSIIGFLLMLTLIGAIPKLETMLIDKGHAKFEAYPGPSSSRKKKPIPCWPAASLIVPQGRWTPLYQQDKYFSITKFFHGSMHPKVRLVATALPLTSNAVVCFASVFDVTATVNCSLMHGGLALYFLVVAGFIGKAMPARVFGMNLLWALSNICISLVFLGGMIASFKPVAPIGHRFMTGSLIAHACISGASLVFGSLGFYYEKRYLLPAVDTTNKPGDFDDEMDEKPSLEVPLIPKDHRSPAEIDKERTERALRREQREERRRARDERRKKREERRAQRGPNATPSVTSSGSSSSSSDLTSSSNDDHGSPRPVQREDGTYELNGIMMPAPPAGAPPHLLKLRRKEEEKAKLQADKEATKWNMFKPDDSDGSNDSDLGFQQRIELGRRGKKEEREKKRLGIIDATLSAKNEERRRLHGAAVAASRDRSRRLANVDDLSGDDDENSDDDKQQRDSPPRTDRLQQALRKLPTEKGKRKLFTQGAVSPPSHQTKERISLHDRTADDNSFRHDPTTEEGFVSSSASDDGGDMTKRRRSRNPRNSSSKNPLSSSTTQPVVTVVAPAAPDPAQQRVLEAQQEQYRQQQHIFQQQMNFMSQYHTMMMQMMSTMTPPPPPQATMSSSDEFPVGPSPPRQTSATSGGPLQSTPHQKLSSSSPSFVGGLLSPSRREAVDVLATKQEYYNSLTSQDAAKLGVVNTSTSPDTSKSGDGGLLQVPVPLNSVLPDFKPTLLPPPPPPPPPSTAFLRGDKVDAVSTTGGNTAILKEALGPVGRHIHYETGTENPLLQSPSSSSIPPPPPPPLSADCSASPFSTGLHVAAVGGASPSSERKKNHHGRESGAQELDSWLSSDVDAKYNLPKGDDRLSGREPKDHQGVVEHSSLALDLMTPNSLEAGVKRIDTLAALIQSDKSTLVPGPPPPSLNTRQGGAVAPVGAHSQPSHHASPLRNTIDANIAVLKDTHHQRAGGQVESRGEKLSVVTARNRAPISWDFLGRLHKATGGDTIEPDQQRIPTNPPSGILSPPSSPRISPKRSTTKRRDSSSPQRRSRPKVEAPNGSPHHQSWITEEDPLAKYL